MSITHSIFIKPKLLLKNARKKPLCLIVQEPLFCHSVEKSPKSITFVKSLSSESARLELLLSSVSARFEQGRMRIILGGFFLLKKMFCGSLFISIGGYFLAFFWEIFVCKFLFYSYTDMGSLAFILKVFFVSICEFCQ